MKQTLVIAALMVAAASCSPNEKGNVDIKGYLMYQCGSTDPLGGVDVTFGINGTDLITTKTDAFGYFELKGSYNYNPTLGSPIEKSVAIVSNGQNGAGFGSIGLACMVPDNVNLDTIYLENSTMVRVMLAPPSNGYGNVGDSLFIGYEKPLFLRANSNDLVSWYVIALPVTDSVFLDPIETNASRHVGFGRGNSCGITSSVYYGLEKNFNQHVDVDFIPGQPNHACGRVYDVTIDLSK